MQILEEDKWSGIDLGIKLSDHMEKAKKLLLAEIKGGEKALEAAIEKEKKDTMLQQATLQLKISEEKNLKMKKVSELANLIGENITKIATKTGISRDETRECYGKALEQGMLYSIERMEKRKHAIKLLQAGKSLDKLGLSEEEAKELLEKAKKYYFISRRTEITETEKPEEAAVEAKSD